MQQIAGRTRHQKAVRLLQTAGLLAAFSVVLLMGGSPQPAVLVAVLAWTALLAGLIGWVTVDSD